MPSTYLAHHGIMGMHWGVRRFQNEDGTLTDAGKARYAKVDSNERLRKKDTKDMKRLLTREIKKAQDAESFYIKDAARANARANKIATKIDKKIGLNDHKGVTKLTDRQAQHLNQAKYAEFSAEYAKKRSESLSKTLSEVDQGILKAGRDYIIQRDYNVYVLPNLLPLLWGEIGASGHVSVEVQALIKPKE